MHITKQINHSIYPRRHLNDKQKSPQLQFHEIFQEHLCIVSIIYHKSVLHSVKKNRNKILQTINIEWNGGELQMTAPKNNSRTSVPHTSIVQEVQRILLMALFTTEGCRVCLFLHIIFCWLYITYSSLF